jgi:hypothetical protein
MQIAERKALKGKATDWYKRKTQKLFQKARTGKIILELNPSWTHHLVWDPLDCHWPKGSP